MDVFIYEWVCGGGFLDRKDHVPESLLAEGAAMLTAVADDFGRVPGVAVRLLLGAEFPPMASAAEHAVVHSSEERDAEFERLASQSTSTLLIAPEFEGILLSLVGKVVGLGGRLLSPGADFVAIASDKQRTAETLHAAGIPVPRGTVLMPGEPCPAGHNYPAMIKPIDGCGSLGIHKVHQTDVAPAATGAYRLEEFAAGMPASVVVACGPNTTTALEPCFQRLDKDFAYLGGALPLDAELRERARQLAVDAVEALPSDNGLVGVDLVLGPSGDGSQDVVIEINPRYTTSYVGLRAATDANLAELCLAGSNGAEVKPPILDRAVEWTAAGQVQKRKS